MKKSALFLLLIFLSLTTFSQSDTSLVRIINPSTISTPKGYSHVVAIDLGNCTLVIISGQVALDKSGNLVGKDDLVLQAEQVFRNIKECVTSAGGTMNDLVKLSYFMLDVGQIQKVREARDRYINTKKPPASTLVQVSKLFREDVLIEIEATAVIPPAR